MRGFRISDCGFWIGPTRMAIVTLALSILAAPLAAEAQQPEKVPRIGFLGTVPMNPHDEALRQGLHEFG